MRVRRVELEDFRNYAHAELNLSDGLNLIVGANAQGKTNLLEAIHCLAGLGSPRGPDGAMVKDGKERALLHADVTRGDRTVRIDMELRPGRGTRALLNRTPIGSTRALGEVVTTVFFGPDELSLVKGSPDGRRRWLDDLVVKVKPTRHSLRREWERVLKQRNALLKSAPRGSANALATLDVWDETFARVGASLVASRLETLAGLIPFARKRFEELAGAGRIELAYSSAWLGDEDQGLDPTDAPNEEGIRDVLMERVGAIRSREIERGASLVGPQRDDVAVHLSSSDEAPTDARLYASQGDQRTSALALKLAEFDLLSETLRDQPVLLLDDVFSELDRRRRDWLAGAVRDLDQVVMTSAEPGAAETSHAAATFEVTSGRVTRVEVEER